MVTTETQKTTLNSLCLVEMSKVERNDGLNVHVISTYACMTKCVMSEGFMQV